MNTGSITVVSVEARKITAPLRFCYSHAKADHRAVSSVLCIIRDREGNSGYGEAVPRAYVTGENPESVIADIKEICARFFASGGSTQNAPNEIGLEVLKARIVSLASEWKGAFPSCAFCAFEGALLDLLCRKNNVSLAGLFGIRETGPLTYSGSIGISRKKMIVLKAAVYKAMGFRNYKIKVGASVDMDKIKFIQKTFGRKCSFYADANCSWDREDAVRNIEQLCKLGIWAIEEPLRHRRADGYRGLQLDREAVLDDEHYRNYAWVRERSPLPHIADESLISLTSFHKIVFSESFDIFNIRLSKCGGFVLSSLMIREAEAAKLSYGIGAMVAESPLLACEGSHFGLVHGSHRYIQGHSHKALFSKQIAGGGLAFRSGARIVPDLSRIGLGLSIREKRLGQITETRELITL